MTPRHHQHLPLPYAHLDPVRDLSRLSADISYADKALIKNICPKRGILNQIAQNVYSSICNNLRNHGITHYSPQHELQFIELVTRGCTALESFQPRPWEYGLRPVTGAHPTLAGRYLEFRYPEEPTHRGEGGEESKCKGSEQNRAGDCEADGQVS